MSKSFQWRRMSVISTQLTSNSNVFSTFCSGVYHIQHHSFPLLVLCEGKPPFTSGFSSQRASNVDVIIATTWAPSQYKDLIHTTAHPHLHPRHTAKTNIGQQHRRQQTIMPEPILTWGYCHLPDCNITKCVKYIGKKYHSKLCFKDWYASSMGQRFSREMCNHLGTGGVYSISQEICTRFLLCCALLWLYIDWFSHIHQAYFTGTVAIWRLPQCQQSNPDEYG